MYLDRFLFSLMFFQSSNCNNPGSAVQYSLQYRILVLKISIPDSAVRNKQKQSS